MMLQFHLFDLDKDRMIDYHELKVAIFQTLPLQQNALN